MILQIRIINFKVLLAYSKCKICKKNNKKKNRGNNENKIKIKVYDYVTNLYGYYYFFKHNCKQHWQWENL